MAKAKSSGDVSIGKFAILASCTYTRACSTAWPTTRPGSGGGGDHGDPGPPEHPPQTQTLGQQVSAALGPEDRHRPVRPELPLDSSPRFGSRAGDPSRCGIPFIETNEGLPTGMTCAGQMSEGDGSATPGPGPGSCRVRGLSPAEVVSDILQRVMADATTSRREPSPGTLARPTPNRVPLDGNDPNAGRRAPSRGTGRCRGPPGDPAGTLSHRFGLGMAMAGGPMAYQSRRPGLPLTEPEEALLAYAACGITGYALADLVYEPGQGGTMMAGLVGRTIPSGDATHSVALVVTNPQATYYLRRPQDFDPAEVPELVTLARRGEYGELHRRSRVRLRPGRATPPLDPLFNINCNRWSLYDPAASYFLPVSDLTLLYLNGMLEVFDEATGAFVVDERAGFRPAGVGRFARSRGGHLRDDPRDGRVLTIQQLEGLVTEFVTIEQGMLLQNLALMVQAMGLGGFPHWAAHAYGWFEALGFRMGRLRASRYLGMGRVLGILAGVLGRDRAVPYVLGLEHAGCPYPALLPALLSLDGGGGPGGGGPEVRAAGDLPGRGRCTVRGGSPSLSPPRPPRARPPSQRRSPMGSTSTGVRAVPGVCPAAADGARLPGQSPGRGVLRSVLIAPRPWRRPSGGTWSAGTPP